MTGEAARLEALRAAKILDTPPEASFDALTELASFICRTPISTVTMVDEHRQWFKSRVGIDEPETPLAVSFCAVAIKHDGMTIVPDARADDRFKDFSNVIGDPGIRFYAGVPLCDADGLALGTLCVADHMPRELDAAQARALNALALQAQEQIRMRRLADDLRAALQQVKQLRELVPMCAWCRRLRNDANFWEQVEQYLQSSAGVDVTHGICPECAEKAFDQH